MDNSDIVSEIKSIHKQGYCDKQSRFLKSWRKRWIVLTNNLLLTYKEQRVYQNPTEVIQLKEILAIKTADEESGAKNCLKIQTNETTFFFNCDTALQKEQWIGSVGRALVQRNNREYDD